jgi:lysophospholipase L1-like esterase/nicotinamidase-related amidase
MVIGRRNPRPKRIPFMTTRLLTLAGALAIAGTVARGEHDGRIQILLLGDSTTEASIPKKIAPQEPQLEDVIRQRLAAEGDLPPANVINSGVSGEFIRRLIDSGRYDKQASKLPGLDYILIRYGLNDVAKRENFDTNFVKDFRELLARLRKDHPAAMLIPMTVIPMAADLAAEAPRAKRINDLVRQVANEEQLGVFDIYPRYAEEQAKGPNMLNYRRYPLAKIPEKLRELALPYVADPKGKEPSVIVLDNRLDAHFGNLPGWTGDRHPNLAGYRVIADETAKFLAPIIRNRSGPATPLTVSLQSREADGTPKQTGESWNPRETAVIVCDMWDLHHCRNAVKREGEMAPRMNAVLEKARAQGVFIIHAPSGCMKAYEGSPARERAKSAPRARNLPDKIGEWCRQIPAEEKAVYPIDQTDGGEDDDPVEHAAWAKELAAKGLNPRAPWTRQIDVLRIDAEKDAISDSGVEIWNLLEARGLRNVILMGVHVNMCVAGRPFGLRQLAQNGKHVVLMRDMTDSMYNPARWPNVDHFRGTELFVEHVEKLIAPTITSDQIIGGKAFVFRGAPERR